MVCAALLLRLPSRKGLTRYVGRRTCSTKKLMSPSCTRCFECSPRFAAQARLGQQVPDATLADLQSLLRQSMLDATGAVGAAPLRKIVLHFLLQLLIDIRVGAGRAVKPLIIATA